MELPQAFVADQHPRLLVPKVEGNGFQAGAQGEPADLPGHWVGLMAFLQVIARRVAAGAAPSGISAVPAGIGIFTGRRS